MSSDPVGQACYLGDTELLFLLLHTVGSRTFVQSIDHPLSSLLLLTSVRALLTLDQNLVEQAKNELEPVKLVGRMGGGRRRMVEGRRRKEDIREIRTFRDKNKCIKNAIYSVMSIIFLRSNRLDWTHVHLFKIISLNTLSCVPCCGCVV